MQLKIEYLPIENLAPYLNNARKHEEYDVGQIAKSIEKYGFNDPIGIWKGNVIIEGHGRLLAAKKLGMDTVPVIRLDHLNEDERREYAIMHNKTAELSEWDKEMLAFEVGELEFDGFDIDFGLETDEDEPEVIEDDYDESGVPETPTVQMGQIWQLGRHRLMCGDSTDVTSVEALMGGQKADLLITDPPYNVDYTGKGKNKLKIENDKMNGENFREFLSGAFYAADTVMKQGAVFYIWHADRESVNFRIACDMVGWEVRETLIWAKNNSVFGRQDYHYMHEPCLYGWKEGASHLWASDRKQTTLMHFDRINKCDIHPTMKPVALFDYQIKNNTKGGDIVLDLFGGSGTTMIACEQNGRSAYLMELDPHYCDIIIDRWEKLTGGKAELINV